MKSPVFDRLVQFDEKSRQYPIRTLVPKKPRSYTWSCKTFLDQGSEGACVGFSWAHELAARPKAQKGITTENAQQIYRTARTLDEWEGEDYEGTSVLAGAKAVSNQGLIKEYRWAFGLDDLILAVGYAGTAVLGVNWYSGMMNVNSQGFLVVSGSQVGGHAILCHGVNVREGYFKVHNSWGQDWGVNGEAKISFADMARLLQEQGEACIPLVRK